MDLKKIIRIIPNFPKEGIQYRDITTLLIDPVALAYAVDLLAKPYYGRSIDKIAGIESRGFIFGVLLAQKLNKPFVPIRKKGKLPAATESQDYELEYGTDTIEIHKDAINTGDQVLIIDDLMATGGTMKAAVSLVEKMGGAIHGISCVIDLPEVGGSKKLEGYNTNFLMTFDGD